MQSFLARSGAMRKDGVNSVIRIAVMILLLSFLSGCSSSPAGISDRGQPPSIKIKTHRVDVGETLYSIAWRYDLNVSELARANSMSAPYIINPGQKLSLVLAKKGFAVNSVTRHAVTVGDTLFSIASKYPSSVCQFYLSIHHSNDFPFSVVSVSISVI